MAALEITKDNLLRFFHNETNDFVQIKGGVDDGTHLHEAFQPFGFFFQRCDFVFLHGQVD